MTVVTTSWDAAEKTIQKYSHQGMLLTALEPKEGITLMRRLPVAVAVHAAQVLINASFT